MITFANRFFYSRQRRRTDFFICYTLEDLYTHIQFSLISPRILFTLLNLMMY
jgi:hypothetical protein